MRERQRKASGGVASGGAYIFILYEEGGAYYQDVQLRGGERGHVRRPGGPGVREASVSPQHVAATWGDGTERAEGDDRALDHPSTEWEGTLAPLKRTRP